MPRETQSIWIYSTYLVLFDNLLLDRYFINNVSSG